MLDFNTMRYGTDVFTLQESPKLYCRCNNTDVYVTLVEDQPQAPYIALRTDGKTWYVKLSTSSTGTMSIRINNTNYTLIN